MLKSMLASIVDLLLGGSACQVYRCKSRVFKQHELCILPGMRVFQAGLIMIPVIGFDRSLWTVVKH